MMAFDTDVLTEILLDNPLFVDRAAAIPQHEQAVPIVVIEEILRGRLNIIRQAEAHTARINVARAYDLFEQTIRDFQRLTILSYTPQTSPKQTLLVNSKVLGTAALHATFEAQHGQGCAYG